MGIFRWGNYWKVLKFYAVILTIFWKKRWETFQGGILFKRGYLLRKYGKHYGSGNISATAALLGQYSYARSATENSYAKAAMGMLG